jgi:BirA family biotin operon repressor/biotin-[acetyl-CoA-carboxylase] ligase
MIHEGLAQHGMAIFSHEQTEGRGQRSKSWISEKDRNILQSICLDPSGLSITKAFEVSACVSMTLHQLFSREAGTDTRIKWPNDLYWQDRKAGGILIENIVGTGDHLQDKNNWAWSIVGCGVNINQESFGADIGRPVSLRQITGKNFDLVPMARELQSMLVANFNALLQQGFDYILDYYNQHLFRKGEFAFFKKQNRRFEAEVIGVDANGHLVIQHGITENIRFGDIEWII